MNDLLAARARLSGGLVTAEDARACGYDRQALSRLARSGRVVRVGVGAYIKAASYESASPEQLHRLATRAVVQRFAGGAAASHYSALTVLALPVWRASLERVHVTRTGDGCARRSPRLHIHRCRGDDAYTMIDGAACVRPALAWSPTKKSWLERLSRHPSVRAARTAVDLADGRSESVGESRTRLVLRSFDLGIPTPQVDIRDDDGYLVGRVDFLFEQQRTIVAFDGLIKYAGAGAFSRRSPAPQAARDRRRRHLRS